MLIKDWHTPLDTDARFRADLSSKYFHMMGTSSLVHPVLDDSAIVTVNLDWRELPEVWSLATSFGSRDRCQSFHGMWRDALNSLFVGGDYRIYRTTISGNELDFAIRGKWSFSDEELVQKVRKIVEFERGFWHDNAFPYFLVTITPMDREHGSTGGTALTNSFMMHLSRLDSLSPSVLGTVAHETFHTWNPSKIGYRPAESKYLTSWFWEGFTYYYQDVILARSGILSFPNYVTVVNEKLRRYEADEGMEVSLQEFARHHLANKSSQTDYRHGAVVALWLDTTIRRESSRSLDDLMFDLFQQNAAYEIRHKGRPIELTNNRIFRAASKYLDGDSLDLLSRYVEQGGDIPIPQDALGPCVQSRIDEIPQYHLGFDPASTIGDDHVVRGVDPESEAYKAGLRNGMQLSGWSFSSGDASKQVRLWVNTTNGSQMLAYYPQGAKRSVRQFAIDSTKYASDPQGCAHAIQASIGN